jgi:hypothetical protein
MQLIIIIGIPIQHIAGMVDVQRKLTILIGIVLMGIAVIIILTTFGTPINN